ncbi:hypothetical protein [Mycobacterium sp.]|uniref:hypothetical protein n=1 Tax=Mycobacterium sp. TaxID=1785 RepID=UPI003BACACF0
MDDTNEPVADSARSKADAMALAEEAEAEAAEAEALAAAARARAQAARMRREAIAIGETTDPDEEGDPDDADWETTNDAEYEDDETAEPEVENSPSRRRWLRLPRLSTIAQTAAIVIICCFAGLSGYILWTHHEATERQERVAAFAAGAREGVVAITSLDFKNAKKDVQRVIDSSTGDFKDDFQRRAADFTKVVEQSKVVAEGTVNATAVASIDGHTALVLVAATSRVANAEDGKDKPQQWRLKVSVTEVDGQYKMSKVEFVS